ncbi:2'-5' RNA ligase family protein [Flavobacterium pallidum]|uniref:2'-5' RNA ligase n=1 Tax=Flavobacterium pallidum TaxID=2172098 RepID=A0A2S1SHQ1_9FLAO|nr:2'-5' RNA ligase family protein [Flavobacterium pallidum]AWI25872.1 2'-5' RNA ligase [Flavobacterium pallidum]
MIERYSIVLYPPPEIVEIVRQLKLELKSKIGWFASVNSEAHITICEFAGENSEFQKAMSYLEKFADAASPASVCFNTLGSFPNGAFYLSPDQVSRYYMVSLMKSFAKSFPVKPLFIVDNPHMSIGRKLKPAALAAAFELFSGRNLELYYICNRISLRKFNPERKQFDVVAHFYFKGAEDGLNETSQLALF